MDAKNTAKKSVAILGASSKPQSFGFKATHKLAAFGYAIQPVHPSGKPCGEYPTVVDLKSLAVPIDTLTVYVNPKISSSLQTEITALQVRRVIFNPGTENPALASALKAQGVHVVEACTLVLLDRSDFDTA
jgi:predicted CoA-binding protein